MSLSAEARHVIDALEAHMSAVNAAVRDVGDKGLVAMAAEFGAQAIEVLESWGVGLRNGSSAGPVASESASTLPEAGSSAT